MPRKPRKAVGQFRLNKPVDTRVVYCGDNLDVLKKLPDACIDLIYIDPPFFSGRNYEILWGETWERRAFEDRHESIGEYRRFMEERCIHLARVLKPTGTFYLHCDWHAGHHLKVMLDGIFGEANFLNEIVWQRTNSRTEKDQWPRLHDTLLVYTGGGKHTFRPIMVTAGEARVPHTLITGSDGLKYNTKELTGPGLTQKGESGKPWREYDPSKFGRHWGYSAAQLDAWDKAGRIHWPKKKTGKAGGFPRLLDEHPFKPAARTVQVGTVWTDIQRLNQTAKERIGYPTQKPLALLERIIHASSNEGDVVLDAFCGCGTTLEAAEMMGRAWIGIDFSPTACQVMAQRLEKRCKIKNNEALWHADTGFIVKGVPIGVAELEKMDPFDFQNWAIIAIDGFPNRKKSRDLGIDGRLYPANQIMGAGKGASGEQLEFTVDTFHPIQTKQVQRAGRPEIDKFETAMRRVDAHRGIFVAFGFSRDALKEIKRFQQHEGRTIVPMTVAEILEEQERERDRKLA